MTIKKRKVCDGCNKTITNQHEHQAIMIGIEACSSDGDSANDVCIDLDFHRACQSKIQLTINERLK